MPLSTLPPSRWDFNAALNLINSGQDDWPSESSLSPPPSLSHSVSSSDAPSEPSNPPQSSLGNFDKLWQFLGTSAPTSSLSELVALEKENVVSWKLNKEPKTVTWSDKPPSLSQPVGFTINVDQLTGSPLNKTQRKKLRRRLRKINGVTDSTSADDQDLSDYVAIESTPMKIRHPIPDVKTDSDAKATAERQSKARHNIIQKLVETQTPVKKSCITSPHDIFVQKVAAQHAAPETPRPSYNPRSRSEPDSLSLPDRDHDLANAFEKKQELMRLLHKRFPADRQHLAGISHNIVDSPYSSQQTDSAGIHVFVDISNILIGLHDAIKLHKGLNRTARIPRQKLSFHRFAMTLERGRPTAKRCLAGSDMLECIDEAILLGYDANILERVMKEKALTPRQRYFRGRDRGEKSGASSGGEATSGPGSGTEEEIQTVTRRVEQAVDEILHLNMMLSIVDTVEPSTIVLATGDAAEAEYSEGFLSMCERALSKGWNVEVVAFKHNMSFSYRRKDWIQRWNGRFKIIELDEFVEQLRL